MFRRGPYAGTRSWDTKRFRVVGVRNEDADDYHFYITNLPRKWFFPADIATIYRCRWAVESLYIFGMSKVLLPFDGCTHSYIMREEEIKREYGTVNMSPMGDIVAGSYGTWTIQYTVGALGMDDGAALKIAMHQTSDWGISQFDDPTADNYATVATSGEVQIEGTFDTEAYRRPYRYAIVIRISDGSLEPDDTIILKLGDISSGSMGQQAQSFSEQDFRFRPLVDPHKTGEFVELPEKLSMNVVPGPASSIEAVLTSSVEPNTEATLSLRAEDYWGNVATGFSGTLETKTDEAVIGPSKIKVKDGIGHVSLSIEEEGTYRVTVQDDDGEFVTLSNPCVCRSNRLNTYWGDIHGQSRETVGHGTVQEYFDHLSNHSFVDFGSHAGNDFQITDEFWEELQSTVNNFNSPGDFITFLCYEWSANTSLGGDHNVYFLGDRADIKRSSKWLTENGFDKSDGTHPASALYDWYCDRNDVMIIPHQGGRPATLDTFDPDLTPFIEITSVWGVFEWFAGEAMSKNYTVGFVGGSDDHCGRPGTAPPDNLLKHNMGGGLMATIANNLDRSSLWEAFQSRRVYGTTGVRTLLDIDVAGASMGETVETSGPIELNVSVYGTAPIRDIGLIRGTKQIASKSFTEDSDRIEICWSGQRRPRRSRDKVIEWTGGASVDQGVIESVEEFGFNHPEDGVVSVSDMALRWEGYTVGNQQGVRLGLDTPDDACLTVSTPPASVSVSLANLSDTYIEADGVNAGLRICRIGEATNLDVTTSFRDDPPRGQYPYYIRVNQNDGEMAWSSPVFVTIE